MCSPETANQSGICNSVVAWSAIKPAAPYNYYSPYEDEGDQGAQDQKNI